tara:strand:+ start:100 stop:330 length:231 start_codon:yes stop_codon:yes gene_type:complete
MTTVDIVPVTRVLDKLEILDVVVQLDSSARITALVKGGNINEGHQLLMDGASYAAWGSDDEYVVNWTLEQLGLTKA